MKDDRHIAVVAAVLLVTLRLAIGWQLLYEGLWKIQTLRSPDPWTAAGYLRNAQGPLRDVFRQMAGDPDDLDWLNVEKVAARWDRWQARFASHYGLSDNQKRALDRWVNGAEYYAVELDKFPEQVDLEKLRLHTVVSYDLERKILKVDGKKHLQPVERDRLLAAVESGAPGAEEFKEAVRGVYRRSKDGLSFKEKLRATVLGNPDWVSDEELQRVGEIDQYKAMLAAYEARLDQADQDFQWDHLEHTWGKIQAKRAQLVGPVKALDDELKEKARSLLTVEQLTRGPLPEPWTMLRISDLMTILGLTILGAMLILGLGTRMAAVLAALMVGMFYLAMPPWPGVPEVPGPEHSYIVNKNLIEVVALMAIAALPSGRWFGVDGVIGRLWARRQRKAKSPQVVAKNVPAGVAD